jgi:hypothetical protein
LLMRQRSLCHQLVERLDIGTSSRSESGTDRGASYRRSAIPSFAGKGLAL